MNVPGGRSAVGLPRRTLLAGSGAVITAAGLAALSSGTAGAATRNPVIPGYHADPWVTRFGDRYYLYPTTDGVPGWTATSFRAFSSPDLQNWTDEGGVFGDGVEKALSVPGEAPVPGKPPARWSYCADHDRSDRQPRRKPCR